MVDRSLMLKPPRNACGAVLWWYHAMQADTAHQVSAASKFLGGVSQNSCLTSSLSKAALWWHQVSGKNEAKSRRSLARKRATRGNALLLTPGRVGGTAQPQSSKEESLQPEALAQARRVSRSQAWSGKVLFSQTERSKESNAEKDRNRLPS